MGDLSTKLHEVFLSSVLMPAGERAADTAHKGDSGISETVTAALVVTTDWKGTRTEDAVFKA